MSKPPKPASENHKDEYEQNVVIPRQLRGKICNHVGHVSTEKNRKGQQFKECSSCGAFLGFC